LKRSHPLSSAAILDEPQLCKQGKGGFGLLVGCWVHHSSRIDEMVIPHCNCAKKEWEVVHLCGL